MQSSYPRLMAKPNGFYFSKLSDLPRFLSYVRKSSLNQPHKQNQEFLQQSKNSFLRSSNFSSKQAVISPHFFCIQSHRWPHIINTNCKCLQLWNYDSSYCWSLQQLPFLCPKYFRNTANTTNVFSFRSCNRISPNSNCALQVQAA